MITEALPKSDAQKLSLATSLRVATANLRILDHATGGRPSSERMIQDFKHIMNSLDVIITARGEIAEGITGPITNWGGIRVNQPSTPTHWMHSDTEGCVEDMVQKSIMTINNTLNGQHKLTIVDPIDNSDETQSEINAAALIE
jgi:hypothetical protein